MAGASTTDNRTTPSGFPVRQYARPPIRNLSAELRRYSWECSRPFFPKDGESDFLLLTPFISRLRSHLKRPADIETCREMIKGAFGLCLEGPLGVCVVAENEKVRVEPWPAWYGVHA